LVRAGHHRRRRPDRGRLLVPAGNHDHRTDTANSIWGLHDLVKTKACIFNGYGHIHQDYVKVDGEWKVTRSHTSRLFVDEQWL
jgi:hypothetical protein